MGAGRRELDHKINWASTWNFGLYHDDSQRSLRAAFIPLHFLPEPLLLAHRKPDGR